MTDYSRLYDLLENTKANNWAKDIYNATVDIFSNCKHGDFEKWKSSFDNITVREKTDPVETDGYIKFGSANQVNESERENLITNLKEFLPWRKGPYILHGINIDTEWHSDWKWDRIKDKISSLTNRNVLDIGCGNGYHLWRMYLDGAKLALGVDPYMLSVMQFNVINKFSLDLPVFVTPLGVDEIPQNLNAFETVFSMGLLYHRKDPKEHIEKLFSTACEGGEVVLETLILDSDKEEVFIPEGRYAKMRNVWNLPSPSQIIKWMNSCGFKNVKCVDINKTSIKEQRVTEWMQFESLVDYLDPSDQNRTIEGHQAPIRAVFIGTK